MQDDISSSPNPRRFYREPNQRWLAGVCSGVARYFNIDATWVRIGFILGLFTPMNMMLIIGYLVAAFVTPLRPQSAPEPRDAEEERFWRGVSRSPQATFSNLKYRFKDFDARLADMERVVTSKEWKLRRAFDHMERDGGDGRTG